jgi:alkanesulfonate monooxygenase SsuD/methylene tetrahydromethanopterin reductase-like flavin-dependent oxidoreductase (luciferase family)
MTRRFGIAFVHQPPEPTQGAYVKLTEDRGFDSAWAVETRLMRGGITPLTAWAAETESIDLGTAMVNPYT